MSRRSDRRDRRAIDKAARETGRSPLSLDPTSLFDATPGPTPPSAAPGSTPGSVPRPRVGADRTAAPSDGGRRLRAWRWPALLLVPGLLVAGTVAEREITDEPASVAVTAVTSSPLPTVSDGAALSSTWYCAAGTATGDDTGAAEQTVHVSNQSDVDRSGTLTVYPEGGQPVERPLQVAAFSTTEVRVSDVVPAPYAAALVEVDGGDIAVQHELAGPAGRSVSPCASTPSPTWTFPVGTTRPGATLTLTLFNPFPGEAVVDVSALSDDGVREPEAYQGLVIPGAGVRTLKVSDVITLRAEVNTLVTARSGRVVAEIVQTSDGTVPTDDSGQPDPSYVPVTAKGLTAMLGAPTSAPAWIFPNGTTSETDSETFVVYNPSDAVAEVDVQVLLDDAVANGTAEPFELTIEPKTYRSVNLFDPSDSRVPPGVGHAVVVRARNEVPIVAGRAISSTVEPDPAGLAYTIGSPAVATRWMAAVGALPDQRASSITIFNPSPDTPATFSVRSSGGGRNATLDGLDSVTVAPNTRHTVTIGPDGSGVPGLAVEVDADQPVVVEAHLRFGPAGSDLAFLLLAPVAGTVSAPSPSVGVLTADAFVVPD